MIDDEYDGMIDDGYDEGIEWMQNMPLGFGHNNYVLLELV